MGFVLKLPTAGAASLPMIGDIGYISKVGLKGLYLINGGSGLTDSSGAGATLSRVHGAADPAYAAGALQFRSATPVQMTTNVTVTGANQTIFLATKRLSTPLHGFAAVGHQGHIFGGSASGPLSLWFGANGTAATQHWNFGLQTKRPQVTRPTNGVGAWEVWTLVRDASRVGLTVDGQPPVYVNYDTADPGTNTTANVVIGDDAAGFRHLDADVGFFAHWQRAMSDAEITATYKAVRRMMLAKGLVL